jgi:hypothetical protein
VRARITLRKELGEEPSPEEVDNAIEKRTFSSVTPHEVLDAYNMGQEVSIRVGSTYKILLTFLNSSLAFLV